MEEEWQEKLQPMASANLHSLIHTHTYVFGQSSNFSSMTADLDFLFFCLFVFSADKDSLPPWCGFLLLLQHICFKAGRVVHSNMHFQSGPTSPADLQRQPDTLTNRNGHLCLFFFPFSEEKKKTLLKALEVVWPVCKKASISCNSQTSPSGTNNSVTFKVT